jgi:predicted phosphodiesterase
MKLQIFSDLHNEFSPFVPLAADADVVILAGDISTKAKGVQWANETFDCPCIYVAGNHEYYGGHLDGTLQKMKATAASHVHVLENDEVVLGGVRFLGTTSWTDFSSTGNQGLAAITAREVMNDFRHIRTDNYRRIRPDDLIMRNRAARTWLSDRLSTPFDGKTVVITHHSPIVEISSTRDHGHITAAYANNWHDLVAQADLWVYGHTHHAVDIQIERTRVISNPRGYPGERTGFDPALIVEVGYG